MSRNNPYQGPELKPGYQGRGMLVYEPLSVLSLTQRLGRLRFACYQVGASLLAGLLMTLLWLFSASLLPQWAGIIGTVVIGVALFIYMIGLMVRRLHDMALSGWWALLALLPLINLPFHLYLYLGDGSSTVNRFGTPNPLPSLPVKVVGGFCWFVNVVTLVAAIVLLTLQILAPQWIEPYAPPQLEEMVRPALERL
ncbi:MAG: DUF805 domain-containing protein [Pseudomonadales bacterium]|nr:DUF805 domain-containing protein [Pseudomonadales bacterium]